ncbi:MAG: dUTP diphosphatase [Bacteroidales bacterium]
MKVKVVRESDRVRLPQYPTEQSIGLDMYAFNNVPIEIQSGKIKLIPTGLRIEVPPGYELQIRTSSALALTTGVIVLNSPGSINSGYEGEINVILANFSPNSFTVNRGDIIAQAVMAKVEHVEFEITDGLGKPSATNFYGFGPSLN